MGKLLAATKEATGVLVAISLLVGLFFPPPTSVALISFMWIVRIASYFFGGWLYIKRVDRSILHASFTGPVLLFLEYFLIHGVLGVGEISNYFEVGMSVRMLELARFAIGFALFLPISMAIAALGAFMAKREPQQAQELDQETGLNYNGFRDYDSATGRYIQSDLIGLVGGINTYAYVGNNPVAKIDSLGLAGMAVYFSGYQVDTGMGFSAPLGHAGVIAINNNTGATQYFDFGRFGGKYGDVRGPFDVGTMAFGKDGMPTDASMAAILKTVSEQYGKGAAPNSVYDSTAEASKIIDFAKYRQTHTAEYPYTLNPFSKNKMNFCDTFAKDALGAGH